MLTSAPGFGRRLRVCATKAAVIGGVAGIGMLAHNGPFARSPACGSDIHQAARADVIHMRPQILATLQACVVAGSMAWVEDESLRRISAVLGATPTSLTACGFAPADVAAFFSNVRGSTELAALQVAQTTVTTAEHQLAAIVKASDPLDVTAAASIEQARAARDAARASLATAINVMIEIATQGLTPAQRQRHAAWRLSPALLPPAFRVVPWTQAELKSLQTAVLEERIAIATQTTVPAEAAALLQLVRAHPDVVDASLRLQTQLGAISSAFSQAIQ